MDAATRVRLSRVHYPVTALGYGRRIGVWFQGCTIGCSGCLARDTWDTSAGTETTVADLVDRLGAVLAADTYDGLTVSGGEPFEQPEALLALVTGVRAMAARRCDDFDVLCYSGLSERKVRRDFPAVLEHLDVLIPEPFQESRPSDQNWLGSANQRFVVLSDHGRRRYNGRSQGAAPTVQVAAEGDRLWLIGVPRRGDLERVERRVADAGVTLGAVSWRP